jgi:RNA polymerase sigma factor (sigma-70 family)
LFAEDIVVKESVSQRADTELTQETFERLLRWLNTDRDEAGRRYEEIRFQLIKIFISRGCLISEELADETINRVARRIQDITKTYDGDPALYFYGVARMIYLEYMRRKPLLQALAPPTVSEEHERRCECLDQCIERLTPKNRELIMAYYKEDKQGKKDQRKEVAERMGMEPNALWVRVHRIRERLRECMVECLKRKQGGDRE